MADNTQVLNPNVIFNGAGDIIATDDVGGVKFQRIKVALGNDGVVDGDVSSTNPLPTTSVGVVSVSAATPVPTTTSFVSLSNSSSLVLATSATFTGTGEDVSGFPSVVAAVKTDKPGILYMEFSTDNVNWDSSLAFGVDATTNEVHRLSVTRRYYRCRYTNTGTDQSYFRLQSLFGAQPGLTSALSTTIQPDADTLVVRSALMGQTDGGRYLPTSSTGSGHLEIAIHDPVMPLGAIHTEPLTPVFQVDAVYGINSTEIDATTGLGYDPGPTIGTNSGRVTVVDNMFNCSTGTTIFSFASLQTRRRLRYRVGQAVVGMFSAMFSSPAANSTVVAGYGTGESGIYFGLSGTGFGILHSTGGVREIQLFTVTNRTTTGGTAVFRLAGLDNPVTLTTAANLTATAVDIASKSYSGWRAEARGSTVVFLANSVGSKTGTFSLTLSTAIGTTGTFSEVTSGVASADAWIPQASWNRDKLDGTGSSGMVLDSTKGNIYRIQIAGLGYGVIVLQVCSSQVADNNQTFITVHTVESSNTLTIPILSQPSFPFTAAAYSTGSTTDVSVSVNGMIGSTEGTKKYTGPRLSVNNPTAVAATTTSYTPLFSVRNDSVINARANQVVQNLLSISGASKSTNGLASFYIIRNAILNTPNWYLYTTSSSMYIDTASTDCTFSDNIQLVWSATTSESGQFATAFTDEITIQPGETITVAVRSVTANATCVAQLNLREDR